MAEVLTALFLFCCSSDVSCRDYMVKCAQKSRVFTTDAAILKCIKEYKTDGSKVK